MANFLKLSEVERVTTLRRSKIYELIKQGEFPAQIKVTASRSAWLQSEIEDWITSRVIKTRGNLGGLNV